MKVQITTRPIYIDYITMLVEKLSREITVEIIEEDMYDHIQIVVNSPEATINVEIEQADEVTILGALEIINANADLLKSFLFIGGLI